MYFGSFLQICVVCVVCHWGIKEVIFLWYCLGGGGRGYFKMIWFRKLRFGNSLQ